MKKRNKGAKHNMTPQEALEIITNAIQTENMTAEQDEALALAQKALKKQIPKKPKIWENRNVNSPVPNDDWGYECPCCGNRNIDYPEHHCECGQALDWSETNPYRERSDGDAQRYEHHSHYAFCTAKIAGRRGGAIV